jgi:hypothetical protein
MKRLIFLLFIAFVSSQIKKGLIQRNVCIGGKIENGKCKCPSKTALFGYECKPCISGKIILGRCKCPEDRKLVENTCKLKCENCTKINIPKKKKSRPHFSTRPLIKKPVIYLYPEENMDISVQLNIKNSQFTTIYPKFNEKNTWNVRAKPNGDILINGRTYPYLFWEADSYNPQETNEGFIVTKENAEQFLEEKLQILGLNEKEKTDFITFWLPKLLSNKLSLCTFQTKKFFENIELNVTPKPDSMIRVFLTIKKLDAPINIKEQKLVSVERKGFTVIEWGGSNL